jgi:hypothetical protein
MFRQDGQFAELRNAPMRITGITDSQRNTGLHDPEDLKQVHPLQEAIEVEQSGGPGKFEMPNWDQASQKKVRDGQCHGNSDSSAVRRRLASSDETDIV